MYHLRFILLFSIGMLCCASQQFGWSDSPQVRIESAKQLLGDYRVNGENTYGADGTYQGRATIEFARDATVARIIWHIAGEEWIGRIDVNPDGSIDIEYVGAFGGGGKYTFHEDGSLHGSWWSSDESRKGHESLEPITGPPSAGDEGSLCGSGTITQPFEMKGHDGTPYEVHLDYTRGRESIDSAACGREYWISRTPHHPRYGVKYVYLVDGNRLRVSKGALYVELPNGSLRLSR